MQSKSLYKCLRNGIRLVKIDKAGGQTIRDFRFISISGRLHNGKHSANCRKGSSAGY